MSIPKAYLILNNVGKKQNFGTLIRSAAAMGILNVFVVGAPKLRAFGNQGTIDKVNLLYWDALEDLKAFLNEKGVEVCGIEIMDEAESINEATFNKPVAFMVGNEGTGMSSKQRAACDRFVYIPQYSGATASLNVAVAGSIVFHHFASQTHRPEHGREGYKYKIASSETQFVRWSQPNKPKHPPPPPTFEGIKALFDVE